MLPSLSQYPLDLLHLFFPERCCACGSVLAERKLQLCDRCYDDLPLTKYWLQSSNPIERIFWGKVQVEQASSFLYFRKGGAVQLMMHELKYRRNYGIGVSLGRWFGRELKSVDWADIDALIPLPLHEAKLKTRGHNQCDAICEGMSEALSIPVMHDLLRRAHQNESQTKKGRYDRWPNVQKLFKVENPDTVIGKHILLVDDVITTGATAEACIRALLEIPGARVSFACIGCPPIV